MKPLKSLLAFSRRHDSIHNRIGGRKCVIGCEK